MEAPLCKRCLLRDTPNADYYQSVLKYRAALPEKDKTPEAEYQSRLAACMACGHLAGGVCNQCGCYVEMRAAALKMHCPPPLEHW